jgi:hypothetical protein
MRNFLASAALATGLLACGVGGEGLEDRTDEPGVLATVTGSIRDPKGLAARGQLHAAVVWRDAQGDKGNGYFVATDDVALSPVALGAFRLDITRPPPEEIVTDLVNYTALDWGSSVIPIHYAQAQIVIYDDRNGNGTLDFVAPGASEAVDDIVGLANLAHLFWFEGPIPDALVFPEEMGRPQPGFNWMLDVPLFTSASYLGFFPHLKPGQEGIYNYNGAENLPAAGPFGWHPVDTPIAIEFTDDPYFDLLMCPDLTACPANELFEYPLPPAPPPLSP